MEVVKGDKKEKTNSFELVQNFTLVLSATNSFLVCHNPNPTLQKEFDLILEKNMFL